MIAKLIYEKWMAVIEKANRLGIPVPSVRDPKTGLGSISLTLVFVSSLLVIIGIVGKWSKIAGEIDMNNAMEFLYSSLALYFGRQWQSKSGSKMETVAQEESAPSASDPKV